MSSFFIKFFNIKKNFLGVISLSFIVFVATVSMLAYVLAPDNSSNANNMNLSIHSQKPGFSVDILKKKIPELILKVYMKFYYSELMKLLMRSQFLIIICKVI